MPTWTENLNHLRDAKPKWQPSEATLEVWGQYFAARDQSLVRDAIEHVVEKYATGVPEIAWVMKRLYTLEQDRQASTLAAGEPLGEDAAFEAIERRRRESYAAMVVEGRAALLVMNRDEAHQWGAFPETVRRPIEQWTDDQVLYAFRRWKKAEAMA